MLRVWGLWGLGCMGFGVYRVWGFIGCGVCRVWCLQGLGFVRLRVFSNP